jgi:hypothetical protein
MRKMINELFFPSGSSGGFHQAGQSGVTEKDETPALRCCKNPRPFVDRTVFGVGPGTKTLSLIQKPFLCSLNLSFGSEQTLAFHILRDSADAMLPLINLPNRRQHRREEAT